MLDVLLCYGIAANMIRAGYLGLVADLLRQVWAACRQFVAVATTVRRPWRSGADQFRRAGESTPRRLARLETYVISVT